MNQLYPRPEIAAPRRHNCWTDPYPAVMIRPTMNVDLRDVISPQRSFLVAVILILALGAFFRLYGQNWDEGHYFHPDERFIATVMDSRLGIPSLSEIGVIFDPAESPLNTRSDDENGNPREFAYGSLPFLVTLFLGSTLDAMFETELLTYQNVGTFGRVITALVDLATVGLVILFARRIFGDLAGVIAGALTAFSVVLIQLAHFFTVDTWVTFFSIATIYASWQVAQSFSWRWSLSAAALGGAALATKVSVGVLGIPILIGMAIGAWRLSGNRTEAVRLLARRLAISAIPTVLVFAVFEPYAIWRPGPFIDDIQRQWEIVNGQFDIPFTRQFIGTISGINEVENLLLWGIAPGFGIAALIAVGVAIYRAYTTRDVRYILILSWIIPYFYVIASSEARFLRYAAPLVPPVAILVGDLLASWWRLRTTSVHSPLIPAAATITVVGITLAWALAFMTVYSGTHPRVEASQWIYENVDPGSVMTHELWDDRLPVRIGVETGSIYRFIEMDLYADRPNDEAVEYIANVLSEADYIVLSSQRLSHSIPRSPWRYPVQSAYYRLLEQEKLGFELAHQATNYPGFGSLRINTLSADESFSVYDHPPVRIFEKVDELTQHEIELRFAHAASQPRVPTRYVDDPTLRLDKPVGEIEPNTTTRWSTPVTESAFSAIAIWTLVILLLFTIGLPLTLRLFQTFSDHGIGFSFLAGLISVGAACWILWSLEYARFHIWLILGGMLVALIPWLLRDTRQRARELMRSRNPLVLGSILAFAAGFCFVLLLRAINPDLWHPVFGGEKPMETAYLNAILRSGEFPPYDPWFADGYINYYYYGLFLLAIPINMTGVPFDLGFQLALATIAGAFASGLFSLGSTVSHLVLGIQRQSMIIASGILTVAVVMFSGNLYALRQAMQERTLSVGFWDSSRVVEFGITEFPYFSFLYGDLHPHLIAAPMLLLIIALGLSWITQGHEVNRRYAVVWTVAAGISVGSLTMVNLWDAPTAGVLLVAFIAFPLLGKRGVPAYSLLPHAGVALGALAIWWLFTRRFFTFYDAQTDRPETTASGTSVVEWFTHFGGFLVPLLVAGAFVGYRLVQRRGLRLRTASIGFVLVLGTYLGSALIFGPSLDSPLRFIVAGMFTSVIAAVLSQIAVTASPAPLRDTAIFGILPFLVLTGSLLHQRPVAAICALFVAAFITFFFASNQGAGACTIAIFGAAGAGLIMVADLVLIPDHLYQSDWERMNTIFKLYFHSWNLLGIVAAIAIMSGVYRIANRRREPHQGSQENISGHMTLTWTGTIFGVILIAGLAAYPLLATGPRLEQQMSSSPSSLTLQGYEWMSGGTIENTRGELISFDGDHEIIRYLNEQEGEPAVVLEASIGAYRGGGSRISSATGLPTVLGWESHQRQQRDDSTIGARAAEIRELYQTDNLDRKRYLLRKYSVDYVVVGDVERHTVVSSSDNQPVEYYGSAEGQAAFEEMVGTDLEIALESGETVLYRVVPLGTTRGQQ
jgi:YYY domain-containing protein